VGSPAEVYQRPADVFVARSLGTPAMNVLAGEPGGRRKGRRADVRVRQPARSRRVAHVRGEVQIGVRPEHIGVSGVDQGAATGVLNVELLATKRSYT